MQQGKNKMNEKLSLRKLIRPKSTFEAEFHDSLESIVGISVQDVDADKLSNQFIFGSQGNYLASGMPYISVTH
jgi:hypothetical protein